jgi:hypothetical protein
VLAAAEATGARLVSMENGYQFEEPFIVDSSKITAKRGVRATPVDQAMADTLATYPRSS